MATNKKNASAQAAAPKAAAPAAPAARPAKAPAAKSAAARPAKAAIPPAAAGKAAKGNKGAKGAGTGKAKGAQAVAGGSGSSRLWVVPVVMLLVLAGVGAFLWHHARYLASLNFTMVREARTIPQGHDRGQGTGLANLAGDKAGQLFMLESVGGVPVRLQRFDRQDSPDALVYTPAKADEDLSAAVDVDCDAQGTVYVLLADGRIQVLDNNLKYLRGIKTGINNPSALSVNSAGRIYVADQPDNKVVFFDAKGVRAGEFGAPGTGGATLVAPAHLRVTADDEVVVVENTETGLRGRIYRKDNSLRKTFLIDKIQNCPPVRLGVNAQKKAFFNDPQGSHGIVVYDLESGNYIGESQATKDGEQFISPGCIGADRFTASVFVHTVTGLIRCELPGPAGDAAEDK